MGETLPNGVKDMGGAMVMDGNKITEYAVGRFRLGTTQMLWLELSIARDEKGTSEWKVKDVLSFPNFTKNNELFFAAGNSSCTLNGMPDDSLVVFVDFVGSGPRYVVRKAWRVNLAMEKFEAIRIAGIKCEFEEP